MSEQKSESAEVTICGLFDMQVCVPSGWTDAQVESFANSTNPAGTRLGWRIRKQGDEWLAGADERVPCLGRAGFIHVMLDC